MGWFTEKYFDHNSILNGHVTVWEILLLVEKKVMHVTIGNFQGNATKWEQHNDDLGTLRQY